MQRNLFRESDKDKRQEIAWKMNIFKYIEIKMYILLLFDVGFRNTPR